MMRSSINIKWHVILSLLLSLWFVTDYSIQAANPVVQERTDAKVKFDLLKPPYPTAVDQAVNSLKKKGGTKVIHKDGATWVIIALGQKPSAGYAVGIEKVEQSHGKIVVRYAEKTPQGMAASMITYPYTVIKMPQTDLPVHIQAKK
ncbi:protease complex subunit PrcB family protein [Ammoniphilus sp. YIM 78166]|uniref:protease complex subunit PrcB family protein n=1 Tax=Ammoniphilus sp. YIM 78166 TaxID=1644106 RepID=UPI00106F55B2|nr:protease complex subunit PrcB family protein [Ammoniphilus sp. YIM 78166]